MDRTTNIIDGDEFVRSMATAGKKGKGKKKATGGASRPPKSQKASTVPTAREKKAAATKDTAARFYEANGLKIPLFDNGGRKRIARSANTIAKKSLEELLDIVEQYAGTDKKEKLRNKGLGKNRLVKWIEDQETLAFAHKPNLARTHQEDAAQPEYRAPTSTAAASSTPKKVKKSTVTAPVTSAKDAKSQIASKVDGTCNRPVKKKRRAPDEPADGQPHQKHQKRDHQANPGTTNTGLSAKDDPTDKQDYDVIPALPQTVKQTTAYNETDEDVRRKVTFMNDISMHPDDPDRSTTVIRGRDEDRVLTTTKRIKGDQTEQVTLHEVSIPHNYVPVGIKHIVPYHKEGKHGPRGDFDNDPDRATGEGHNYNPNDAKLYEEYLAIRRAFRDMYPTWPKLKEGEVFDPEMKADRDMWESWYFDFCEKYSGSRGDRWVCGCSKMIEESEEESEEE